MCLIITISEIKYFVWWKNHTSLKSTKSLRNPQCSEAIQGASEISNYVSQEEESPTYEFLYREL